MGGQARDYDEWRSLGNPGWGWDDVLPVFKRPEDHHLGADAMHGSGGEWRVERQRLSWEILDAFRDAMAEAGIPKIPDFNRGDNEGSGLFEVNQKRGVRWNASKAFLRPAMRRPNLTVITHAQVRRLRMNGRRAAGVEFFRGNEESFAGARIETILAAGAIGSPQILQLSGIGPGALLSQHGIAVAHEPTGRIAQQPALAKYEPSEFLPGAGFRSDEELTRAAGDIGTTIFHPVGTCWMGPDSDPRAVVDARLRVRGVRALRVVDASIMPTITSGNTNSLTLMIAERGSDMIREDRKRLPQERA